MSIFSGALPDRPAVKLWGVRCGREVIHPAYEPVQRLGMELTDLFDGAGRQFNLHYGSAADEICHSTEQPTDSDEWVHVLATVQTPEGTLSSVYRKSTAGKPGYQMEYLLKEPDDIRKLLSIPYKPFPFSAEAFWAKEQEVGDRGITLYGLDHAMYGLQRLIGSENFAFWSIDCRGLLLEAIETFSLRIRQEAESALDAAIKGVYGWVGPELCIPPLMSLKDFEEFVFQFDKPLIDLIHERGGYVWVHSHGRMRGLLDRFVEMGADVLNPIEPPPMGDVTLPEAFERVGDRMALEGNIQTHDIMTASPERMREIVREAMEAGRGRRFILCPSSGYMEVPEPDERMIRNLLIYIEEGVRCAEDQAAGR